MAAKLELSTNTTALKNADSMQLNTTLDEALFARVGHARLPCALAVFAGEGVRGSVWREARSKGVEM